MAGYDALRVAGTGAGVRMEREKQSRLIAPGAGGKHEELPAARTAFVSGFRFPELVQQTLCFARTTTTGTATLVSLTISFRFCFIIYLRTRKLAQA